MRYACCVREDELSKKLYLAISQYLKANSWVEDENCPQIVITIGGDGTVLAAIHKYLEMLDNVAFIGVHTGSLGFFNDYRNEEVKEFLTDLLTKQPIYEYKRLIQAVVDGDNDHPYYALNEVRIENSIKTQVLAICIDNQKMETARASGVCVSTQAGSTAVNRALGGAIVDERIECLQLSEIAPIHNSVFRSLASPLILAKDRQITIFGQDFYYSLLCYDHLYQPLRGKKQVDVRLSDKGVYFAHYRPTNYIEKIRTLF